MTAAQKIILTIAILVYSFFALGLTVAFFSEQQPYKDCIAPRFVSKYATWIHNDVASCNELNPLHDANQFHNDLYILTAVVVAIALPLYKIWGRNKKHEKKDQAA